MITCLLQMLGLERKISPLPYYYTTPVDTFYFG